MSGSVGNWVLTVLIVGIIGVALGPRIVSSGPSFFLQILTYGFSDGAIYALVAIGYTMVYGIIERINFPRGDVFTASGFYAFAFASVFPLDSLATGSFGGLILALVIVFPLSMIAAGITGALIEFVAYRRLRDAPRLAPLITAIGVSFFIEGVMLVIEG